MTKKSRATYFRHSAVLSLSAVLLRKLPKFGVRRHHKTAFII